VILMMLAASCRLDDGPRDINSLPGGRVSTPRPDPSGHKPAGGPVLAIGDSILVGASEHGDLGNKLFADGWTLETVSEEGRSTSWAIDQVRRRATVPKYIVLVLGSNPGFSSAGFADEVQTLRDALVARGARRILWIPPHHTDPTRYEEKVRILRDADAADSRLVVPDWGAVLDANPWYVGGDGLHLTEQGYEALGSFIRDELATL
jgi:lysophospholipase L1-like esterase